MERIWASMVTRRSASRWRRAISCAEMTSVSPRWRGFAEDGELEAACGGEDAVVQALGFADDAVEAAEGERGEALVFDGEALAVGDADLGEEAEVVLAALEGGGLGAVEVHVGELGEGRGVGEDELLLGGEAHDAVELDDVFGEGVFGGDALLLAVLEFDLAAERVEAGADAGALRLVGGLGEEGFGGALRGPGRW